MDHPIEGGNEIVKVFYHHIYEYRKGLRNLILHTVSRDFRHPIEAKLRKSNIAYQIYPLGNGNINIFFGAEECVDVIKAIGKSSLRDYSPEEDFILGTMLGYDRLQQCRRYLGFVGKGGLCSTTSKDDFPDDDYQDDTGDCDYLPNRLTLVKKGCA